MNINVVKMLWNILFATGPKTPNEVVEQLEGFTAELIEAIDYTGRVIDTTQKTIDSLQEEVNKWNIERERGEQALRNIQKNIFGED